MPQNKSVKKEVSQREKAYQILYRMLILQKVPEGQRLREPEWAKRLNVNRMALREAFARLEAEGLIERGKMSGYVVPVLTDHDMREILDVRSLLECGAIDAICRHGRPPTALLQPMREACDQLANLIARGHFIGASEADREFHEALIDAAMNRRLNVIYNRAPLPLLHGRIIDGELWIEEVKLILQEHFSLLDALQKGDATSAKKIIQTHLSERGVLPIHHG